MAINHTWKIDHMDTKLVDGELQKVVKSCRWTVLSVEEVETESGVKRYSASNYGYADFASPNPEDFVAFDSLTEAQVLGWVWANGVDKDAIENSLAETIEAQKTPEVVVLANPWAPAATPATE